MSNISAEWFLENEKDMVALIVSNKRGEASYYYHTPSDSFYGTRSSCWIPPHYFTVYKVEKEDIDLYDMLTKLLQRGGNSPSNTPVLRKNT